MKRILNFTALTITAFILFGTISVMAIQRPFALNAKGVATFVTDGAGNPVSAENSGTSGSKWRRGGPMNSTACGNIVDDQAAKNPTSGVRRSKIA